MTFSETVGVAYDEAGQGTPIVFLHSLTSDRSEWVYQIPHFARGYRAIALDLPGHGDSPVPAEDAGLSIDAYAAAAADPCDALGIAEAVFVGRGMGGRVAMIVAAGRPELVTSLVVLDASITMPAEIAQRQAELVAALASLDDEALRDEYVRMQSATAFLPIDDPDIRRRVLARFGATHPRVMRAGLLDAQRFASGDGLRLLGEIRAPMLFVGSSQGLVDLAPVVAARPDIWIAQVACSGHTLNLQVPDQVNAMIDRFLAVGAAR